MYFQSPANKVYSLYAHHNPLPSLPFPPPLPSPPLPSPSPPPLPSSPPPSPPLLPSSLLPSPMLMGSENSSRSSSSLGYLEPRPCPTHQQDVSPREVHRRLLEKMQNLSTGDSVSESGLQLDSESVDSVVEQQRLREKKSTNDAKPQRFSFFKRWICCCTGGHYTAGACLCLSTCTSDACFVLGHG